MRILAFITGLLSSHKCLFKNKIWCYANRFPNTKSSLIWWRQPLSWSCMEGWFFTLPYVNPIDPTLLRFRMHEFADFISFFTGHTILVLLCCRIKSLIIWQRRDLKLVPWKDDPSPQVLKKEKSLGYESREGSQNHIDSQSQ